jgi:CRISPR/Cas system CSM-associated protein Csm3 (group 7 of RAMP superfamily)
MTITYQIQFHSFWHAGSGLSGGVLNDNEVIKTTEGLPFLPGKTLKGLLREAAIILEKTSTGLVSKKFIDNVFGQADDKGTLCHFTNAFLSGAIQKLIQLEELGSTLYQSLSSTAMDVEGQAKDNSLRTMEVTVPLVLYAQIFDFPNDDSYQEQLNYCLQYIKRMGTKRHRGLGRCDWSIIKN